MKPATGFRKALVKLGARATRRLSRPRAGLLLRWLRHPASRRWSTTDVVSLCPGLRLNVDTSSYLEAHVFFFGSYEPEVGQLLPRLIRPGGCAIDVGANVGVHTLVMARAAGTGAVLACEPNPAILERLRANVLVNRLGNVKVLPLALSDAPRSVDLFVPNAATQSNHATASLVAVSNALVDATSIRVEAVTLDELVAAEGLGEVDLIKVDVEGLEGAVLAGGRELLARDRPALIFEYSREHWDETGYTLPGVLADLRRLGYHTFLNVGPDGLLPISSGPPVFDNVLALARDAPVLS
jgi:FkbM family methyltransferase